MGDRPGISVFFPVYKDEGTIRAMTLRALEVLDEVAGDYEVVIVNDGSPDRCGEIADRLAAEYDAVRVVHHPRNLGYGRAVQTGLAHARRCEWVCLTDGDFQYDLGELYHLVKLLPHQDVLLGFRPRKVYGLVRVLMSAGLNWSVRRLFGTPFRDVTCGLKLIRRAAVDNLPLSSTSPFIGGELAVRAAFKGYRVAEVAISTYPREHGDSAVISLRNIWATLVDILRLRRDLFRNRPREACRTLEPSLTARPSTRTTVEAADSADTVDAVEAVRTIPR